MEKLITVRRRVWKKRLIHKINKSTTIHDAVRVVLLEYFFYVKSSKEKQNRLYRVLKVIRAQLAAEKWFYPAYLSCTETVKRMKGVREEDVQ